MLKFKATDDQMFEIFRLACEASMPAGMGMLHYNRSDELSRDDFEAMKRGVDDILVHIIADYWLGRMVKLGFYLSDGWWSTNEFSRWANKPNSEHQSWATKYPNWSDLLFSAGVTEIEGGVK